MSDSSGDRIRVLTLLCLFHPNHRQYVYGVNETLVTAFL